MGNFCPNCGSTNQFKQTRSITNYDTEVHIVDSEGDWIDTVDSWTDNSDWNDIHEIKCTECGTEAVWCESQEEQEDEMNRYRQEHLVVPPEPTTWKELIEGTK